MKVSIELQKRGFCVETPIRKRRVDWDAVNDALFEVSTICEVDGPLINGCVGVVYDGDDRPDTEIIAELQSIFARF